MKYAKLLMVIAILFVLSIALSAGWDDEIPVEVPRPLDTYLQPVPFETIIVYGNSEKTRVLFNLISQRTDIEQLKEQNNGFQTTIDECKKEAAALKTGAEEQKKAIAEVEDECLKFGLQISSLEVEIEKLKEAIAGIQVSQTNPVIEPKVELCEPLACNEPEEKICPLKLFKCDNHPTKLPEPIELSDPNDPNS